MSDTPLAGKNALVITPRADIDLAVQDLVRSAWDARTSEGFRVTYLALSFVVSSSNGPPTWS